MDIKDPNMYLAMRDLQFQEFFEKININIKEQFQNIWSQQNTLQDICKTSSTQQQSNNIQQINQQQQKSKCKQQELTPQDKQFLLSQLQSLCCEDYNKIQEKIRQDNFSLWETQDYLTLRRSLNSIPNQRVKPRINAKLYKKQKQSIIYLRPSKKPQIKHQKKENKRICKRARPPSIQQNLTSEELMSLSDNQIIQFKRFPSKLINMNTAMYQSKRFKWMIEMIQDSFEITSKNFNIQEVLQSEEYYEQLVTFFNGKGPEKIMFYFQNNDQGSLEESREHLGEQQFKLTTGEDEELKEKAVYFLRISEQDKAINMSDLDGDILFGELSPMTLNQLNMMMTCVFQPLIEKMDKNDWGDCDDEHKNEFLDLTKNFQRELDESLNSLNNNIDKCKVDQQILSSKQSEAERDLYFENLFAEWIQLFKDNFTKDQNEQKKIQQEGPKSELIYWKKVLQDVTLLMELTRTKDFLDVKNSLINKNKKVNDSRTKLLNEYKNIDNILTERTNEAKDNVKYLTTLEKFIEPLYSRTPEEIIETLPALMNAIKMIHTISRYYNTSNKMTGLFVKITNQIITKCKQTILKDKSYEEIWNFEPKKLIATFDSCIDLAQKYKMYYESTKRKASELAKSRHWDFDDSVIFNQLDFFVKRLRKLIELFKTIEQFNTLEKHSNLEGMEELTKNFKKILEEFKKKNHDLLQFENIKLEKDYVELMQRIQKLDSDLQRFIDQNFQKLQNINYSLKLLKKFQKILHSDNIRNRLTHKYETILQNYGLEIEMIQEIFEKQKTQPPIIRNMPPDAGKIIWVRYLFAKLYGPIEEFPPNLINSKDMKKYIDKYNLIGQNLIIYELYFTQSWCNDIDRAKACLQTALFSIKEEGGQKRLKVNFEIDIQKLIREAKALDREGIGSIPESAKIILLQEEKFKHYYFQLDFIRTEYERVISMIKPIMKNILIPHIQNLDLKLRPGIVTLTWTSMNIENFIQSVRKELERLEQLVVVLTDIIENRIENNLKMIGKIVLVKLPEDQNLMSLDTFVETQQKYIQEKAEILISKNTEIERSVDDLLQTLIAYDLDPHVDPIDTRAAKLVKQYYFWYYYQALLNATQRSLNLMKDRICGKRKNSKKQKPFFEVSVTLEDGEVRLVPSLEDIQKAINRAATAVLSCSKKMMSWDQIVKDEEQEEQKESYYKIIAQDKEIVKVILLLTGSIQGTKNKINEFLQSFEEYEWMWNQNIQDEIKKFSQSNPQLQDYEDQFKKFIQLEKKIGKTIRNKEIGAMCLKTDKLIDALLQKCTEWKNNYAWDLHGKAKDKLLLMTDNIKNFQMRLQKEVKEIDSLGQVMNTIEEIGKEQSEKDLKFKPIFEMYTLLDLYLPGGVVDKEVVENRQLLQKKWDNLIELAEDRKNELQKEQGKNLHRLKENITQLTEDVKKLRKNFEDEGPMVRGITPKEASDRLKRFENEYELKKAFYDINKRGEDLFGLRNQKYPMLEKTHEQIQSLNKLYALYNSVNDIVGGWEEEAWSEISTIQIKDWEDSIGKFYTMCTDLPKVLREWQAYKDLKNKIENYKKVLPFISELKQPMIKDRHWQIIVDITKKNLNFAQPDNFYFREVIEANLMDFEEDIEDIIDSAKKQDKIEKTKDEIKYKWNKQEFVFKEWGQKRSVPILSGGCIEEITEQLEEDISILSGLGAMRHIGPFKDEVFELQEMLTVIQETLDLWVKVQILWTSLERVFTEGDISMILTTESKKFKKIDKAWVKTIMEKAAEQKSVKVCCQNEIIKSILPNLQEELEDCQKQLEKYLEMKRKTFPRFYFVSDAVLLKFLSQGSDPKSIQEDFDKLFDAISKVSFEKQKKNANNTIIEIKNVFGSEEEVVKLQSPVVCADYIEKWLQKLEQSMQDSIKHITREAAKDISNCSYKEGNLDIKKFIDDYPAQVVLMGLQIKWTKLVTEALEKRTSEKNKAVNDTKKEIDKIMENLTKICRDKDITKMNRQKIETLVTIMVYLKEVTQTWKFREVTDFEWQKYTRIYWDQQKNNSVIKITDWDAEFKNEYLGVKERLCITPLTDRCYITLAQAMSMHYGGAPAGPAGTGKTETVKDLGRTLGIFVVVTNCSPEHRYTDMAKIFKGLCQSGLWGCFDEFNRIDLEVLSVVAMQIESITMAKKAGDSEFMFPDEIEKVKLIPTCGYFITMNPGYAGRQELPENLKVLFRGVTMMVPDREVIIRVKLASSGYNQYEELAKKFKVLYNLCEEQLSKQKHYDFGLRNILSVLRTAGNILREDESENPNEALLLMRTLRDMNYSKLISSDVNLFQDLLQDIFPKITNPGRKYHTQLEKQIQKVMKRNKLREYQPWIQKIIQLYETVLVRHGCTVVGPTCTGKSTIIKTLLDCLDGMDENKKYIIQRLNPKAFTSQEMYGMKNFAGEWTPGVFSELWRKANEKKENKPHYWLVCDGPIDAIWIENLNTVLDDNKVLTLANGDRIFMLDTVQLLFEVENLNNASPATVSRVGHIYVSQDDLDYKEILYGWINQRTKDDTLTTNSLGNIPLLFNKDDQEKINNVIDNYFGELDIIEKYDELVREETIMEMIPSLKAKQVMEMFTGIIIQCQQGKFNKKLTQQDYDKIMLFSIIWGVAGTYENETRKKMENLLKKHIQIQLPTIKEYESIYDYYINITQRGIEWRLITPDKWKPPKQIQFSRLLMPTLESQRTEILIKYLKSNKSQVLLIGGSGTAKTSSILMFANKFNNDEMLFHRINFSSATLPIHFQTSIESVCETKIRKGFGPKDGKMMTVFIDDLSMPEMNEWGDQVTLEIVRELIEDSGFYRLEKNERGQFKFIENLNFIAAMNHPGGGRNDIPTRLKHHFFIFNMTISEKIGIIFEPILQNIFSPDQFDTKVNDVVSKITEASVKVFRTIKQTLLPTPSKFHYLFNLRDVSRIFKGMVQVTPETIKKSGDIGLKNISSDLFLIALWKHECERVFIDKLVNEKDKKIGIDIIQKICLETFEEQQKDIEEQIFNNNIVFCDFLQYPLRTETEMEDDQECEDDGLGDYQGTYEGIKDIDKLRLKCMGLLRKYNRENPQKRMDLVLFDDALFHLLKISRIISMARSSALLVGVGGSGKQSLTNFAAKIGGQSTFQIQLTKNYNENQFKEDIKNLFDIAGHKGNPVTFILTDAEIKDENFLEYINMVLSTGEIPGLIPKDEKEIWLGDVRTEYVKKHKDNKEPTAIEIYDYFLNRLRDNLHIVLCFSPVGVKFRDRARKFPSLFNECSIDWFLPWPEQALQNVADQFLCDLKLEATDEVRESLPKWMSNVHVMVNESCEEYYLKMRRQVFITPKSYLSFLKAYKKLYKEKFDELDQAESNYKIGLQKIKEAKEDIEVSEKKLKAEEEKLRKEKEEVEKIIVKLNKELAKANEKNEEVSIEKAKIEKEKESVEKDKAICQKELEEAMPALERAQQAANQISAKDISSIKPTVQKSAHIILRYVVDAINVVLYQKVRNDIVMLDKPTYAVASGQKPSDLIVFFEDSWDLYGKQAFFDPSLAEKLQMMAQTENENLINGEILELLEPYTRCVDTWLSKANSLNVFFKMGLIHDWIVQIEKFSIETRNIKPKRIALKQQEEKLKIATDKLAIAEGQLEEIKKKCKELDDVYKMKNDNKNILEDQARQQKKKLDQANKLINSLQDERERWNKGANELADFKRRLIGNVGVATAFISYCGPFNAEFRDQIANIKFIEDLKEKNIPLTNSIYNDLTQFLVDEATVGQWNLEGLPKDVLSIQNGIMVDSSERYPLMIDPQNQGTQWIKNKYSEINPDTGVPYLFVVNINEEKKFRDGLTRCVENGEVLIVEGIESEVDPILDPVLEKKLVKKGRNWKLSLGGQLTDFNANFKLFLTCKLGNPKFSPELSAKTTIIDFTVTQNGLEQQLLSVVLSKKQRVLEESLNALLKEVTQNKKQLKELDKTLLQKLTTSQKNLLEDTELIEILNLTKTQAKEVQIKLADAEIKTKEINEKRLTFQPVAVRGSVLYFCMIEIAQVNWMYNSSLAQFLDLYNSTIDNSPKTALPQKDVENITKALTYNVYRYVNRGLFEKDKITFLLMACFKILITDQKLTPADFSIFLKGGSSIDKVTEQKPKADWITEKIWNNVLVLSQHCFANESVPFFKTLPSEIKNKIDIWKKWAYEKTDPENDPIPEYEERIQNENEIGIFLRLILIRCLREDRTITSCSQFIEGLLGDKFVEPVTDSMESIHQSSSPIQPVLFLLSAGADPTASIDELAKKKKKELFKVSLGEGQEPKADSLLQRAIETGDWVLLQNCHLGLKFMSALDNYLLDEEWTAKINPEFRIWMSCEPREGFPLGLLQRAVKVTNEPPKGIKAGVFKTFNTLVNSEFLERIDHPNWRSLTFATSFLHSVVQERRKFGELGWCIPYEYNYSDLEASLEFIEKYLNQLQAVSGIVNANKNFNISFPVLIYMICEIQYGGKITDNLDRELFSAYGENYFRENILQNDALITKIGNQFKYVVPNLLEHKNYMEYIDKLPPVDNPEIFGLNANADITFRTKETNEMIGTIMKTRPKESSSNTGMTREEVIQKRAQILLSQITYSYPMFKVQQQISKLAGPKTMQEKGMRVPLNIFLFQEIQRMEFVLYLVKKTLNDIIEAVDGQIIMTPQIVEAIDSIFDGKVPGFWLRDTTGAEISWLKPSFPLWFDSLLKRNEQLSNWLNGERPRSFDLGLFFNPQGFLTAMKQEVVRANKISKPGQKNSVEWSMDNVEYSTTVLSNKQQNDFENGKDLFNDGIYIHGLFLEGCKWGKEGLQDSLEKKMVFPMNIIHCTAVATNSRRGVDQEKKDSAYNCPVYKYPLRNDRYLIFRILLNFGGNGTDKNKWKLRGVALLCSTEK